MLKVLGLLLRIYSYSFHLALGAFLIGISALELSRHEPWFQVRGSALLGAMEVACALMGFTRWLRFLFVLSAAMVLYAISRGFLSEAYFPSWLPSAATLAFLGALLVMFRSQRSAASI